MQRQGRSQYETNDELQAQHGTVVENHEQLKPTESAAKATTIGSEKHESPCSEHAS